MTAEGTLQLNLHPQFLRVSDMPPAATLITPADLADRQIIFLNHTIPDPIDAHTGQAA